MDDDFSLFTNIEPKAEINDLEICGDGSGLIFSPQDQEKIGTYFLPSLGPAPKWCSFLEQLTEELEESKSTTLYEDYKFLTTLDLEKLNATHLIGTPALKAYMHGYFMELKAYQKLLSTVNPFAYEKYRKDMIAAKLKAKTKDRINVQKKQLKQDVNLVKELKTDDRFAGMFEDGDFAVDKNSEHYKAIKTTMPADRVDSDNEDKQPNLNKLFSGRNKNAQDEEADFATKMSKNKKHSVNKDKIISNYGTVNRTLP